MNSKFGTFLTTVLILVGITLWSVSVLADDHVDTRAESRVEARQSADDAHREAARHAVGRIKASAKVDFDLGLTDRTPVLVARF